MYLGPAEALDGQSMGNIELLGQSFEPLIEPNDMLDVPLFCFVHNGVLGGSDNAVGIVVGLGEFNLFGCLSAISIEDIIAVDILLRRRFE